jgi:hypothetical protein
VPIPVYSSPLQGKIRGALTCRSCSSLLVLSEFCADTISSPPSVYYITGYTPGEVSVLKTLLVVAANFQLFYRNEDKWML